MYEKLYKNVLFPFYESVVMRRNTVKYLKELDSNQRLSEESLKKKQWMSLRKLLQHAYDNSAYYNQIFKGINIQPNGISSYADFRKLPILSKSEINANKDKMIAQNYTTQIINKSTGGSTGVPLHFAHDRDSYEWRMAVSYRGYSWAGCEPGRKVMYIWSTQIGEEKYLQRLKSFLHNGIQRKKMFSCFKMTTETMQSCFDYIKNEKPDGIVSYTTAIYDLAKYAKQIGQKSLYVPSIVIGAEKLYDYQRKLIESVFNGKVFNTYGCREFMLIAAECEEHKGLHLSDDNLYVEVLKENGEPAKSGEIGEIVITDLHNYGMPFIRYKNGDLVTQSDKICPCGRSLALIEDVEGRLLDSIRAFDGKLVSGVYFPHLMKEFDEIEKFQIIQESIDVISVKIVKKRNLEDARVSFLIEEMKKVLGNQIKVRIVYVEDIPLSSSGKYRVTISKIETNQRP